MGARFSLPVQTGPGAHPSSCTMGTGSFPVVKSGRSVTLIPHPLLVPWSRKSRAITLLPLCAVRPVQSLSACIRLHITFTLHWRRAVRQGTLLGLLQMQLQSMLLLEVPFFVCQVPPGISVGHCGSSDRVRCEGRGRYSEKAELSSAYIESQAFCVEGYLTLSLCD